MSSFETVLVSCAKEISDLSDNMRKVTERNLKEFSENRDNKNFCRLLAETLEDVNNKALQCIKDLRNNIPEFEPEYSEVLEKLNNVIHAGNRCNSTNSDAVNNVKEDSDADNQIDRPLSAETVLYSPTDIKISDHDLNLALSGSDCFAASTVTALTHVSQDLGELEVAPAVTNKNANHPDRNYGSFEDSSETIINTQETKNNIVNEAIQDTKNDTSSAVEHLEEEVSCSLSSESFVFDDILRTETEFPIISDTNTPLSNGNKKYQCGASSLSCELGDSRSPNISELTSNGDGASNHIDFLMPENSRSSEDSNHSKISLKGRLPEKERKSLFKLIASYYRQKEKEKNDKQNKMLNAKNEIINRKVQTNASDESSIGIHQDTTVSLKQISRNEIENIQETSVETSIARNEEILEDVSQKQIGEVVSMDIDFPQNLNETHSIEGLRKADTDLHIEKGKDNLKQSDAANTLDLSSITSNLPKNYPDLKNEGNISANKQILGECNGGTIKQASPTLQSLVRELEESFDNINHIHNDSPDDVICNSKDENPFVIENHSESQKNGRPMDNLDNEATPAPHHDNPSSSDETIITGLGYQSELCRSSLDHSENSSEETVIELDNIAKDIDHILEKTSQTSEGSVNSKVSHSLKNSGQTCSIDLSNHYSKGGEGVTLSKKPVQKISPLSSDQESCSDNENVAPLRKPLQMISSESSNQEGNESPVYAKIPNMQDEEIETQKSVSVDEKCQKTMCPDVYMGNNIVKSVCSQGSIGNEEFTETAVTVIQAITNQKDSIIHAENKETIIELDDIAKDIEDLLVKTSDQPNVVSYEADSSTDCSILQNKRSPKSIVHATKHLDMNENTLPEVNSKKQIAEEISELQVEVTAEKSTGSVNSDHLNDVARARLKDRFRLDDDERNELLIMLNDHIKKSRVSNDKGSGDDGPNSTAEMLDDIDRDQLLELLKEYHENYLGEEKGECENTRLNVEFDNRALQVVIGDIGIHFGEDFGELDSDREELYEVVKEEAFIPSAPLKRGRKKKECTKAMEVYRKLMEDSDDLSDCSIASLSSENISNFDEFGENVRESRALKDQCVETMYTEEKRKFGITKELYIQIKQLDQTEFDVKKLPKEWTVDSLCNLRTVLQKRRKSPSSSRQRRRRKRRRRYSYSSQASDRSNSNTSSYHSPSDREISVNRTFPLPSYSTEEAVALTLCEGIRDSAEDSDNRETHMSEDTKKKENDEKKIKCTDKSIVCSKPKSSVKSENMERKAWKKDPLLRGKLRSSESDYSEKSDSSRPSRRKKFKSKYVEGPTHPFFMVDRTEHRHKSKSDDSSSDSDMIFDGFHISKENTIKIPNKTPLRVSDDSESSSSIEFVPLKLKTPVKENITDDDDVIFEESPGLKGKGRRNIRALVSDEQLAEDTQRANQEEKERIARLEQRNSILESFSQSFSSQLSDEVDSNPLVLDVEKDTLTPLIKVHHQINKKLKPHQRLGVQFMWNSCYESVEQLKNNWEGSGCILAHCMGLGKTIQALALIHTLFSHKITNTKYVLVVCPLSTVSNWKNECRIAYKGVDTPLVPINLIGSRKDTSRKFEIVRKWRRMGGILVLGYEQFATLTDESKLDKESLITKKDMLGALVDPGPDLIICDEGHLLKNKTSQRAASLNRVRTMRRIVLTGTPLQNNLMEYYYMVNFVKPNLLGNQKEYKTNFANPINNGQYEDSTPRDIRLMKERTYVLHTLLKQTVQRVEDTELKRYLPKLVDYGIFIHISDLQVQFYNAYLDNAQARLEFTKTGNINQKNFLADVQMVKYICSHPYMMSIAEKNCPKKVKERDVINDTVQNEQEQEILISKSSWWKPLLPEDAGQRLELGNKLMTALSLVEEAVSLGDKVLIFSQNLAELDCLEHFLNHRGTSTQPIWTKGQDYCRMDGTVFPEDRVVMCDRFNDQKNSRLRLLLMSTKVGGLGLNLTAANRVIIMNVNWNPSQDTQSVFRAFRFGQTKDVYVYRLISLETMEERIYQLQVTKLAIAHRVIDKHQITRHYNSNDIQAMYSLRPSVFKDRPLPNVPEDKVLAKILQKYPFVFRWHEHQGLLANRPEEDLNEQEKNAAWEEFNKRADETSASAQLPTINAVGLQNRNLAQSSVVQATRNLFTSQLPASNMDINIQAVAKAIAEAKQANALRPASFVLQHGSKQVIPSVLNAVRLPATSQQWKQLVPNPASALAAKILNNRKSPSPAHAAIPCVETLGPSLPLPSVGFPKQLEQKIPPTNTSVSFLNINSNTLNLATKNVDKNTRSVNSSKKVGLPGASKHDIITAANKRLASSWRKTSTVKIAKSDKKIPGTSTIFPSTTSTSLASQNSAKSPNPIKNNTDIASSDTTLSLWPTTPRNSNIIKSQTWIPALVSPSTTIESATTIPHGNKENTKKSKLQLLKSAVSIDLSNDDDDNGSTSSSSSLSKDMVDDLKKKGISINMVKKNDNSNDVITLD
ncbi:transcriptional regulator ATRX-like isoform X3 [Cylas formicarius]|uniref:transcriptional regulator ATRX-like isoform X3 n=1 Tax=Cylas formicarius TaxID=197179 RepID=UPI0029589408|nr:transcriptional regulator ATRX-like isoform X3 [Cylas formicarius]